MSLSENLEKSILQNSKIPKWLKATGKNFSQRPELELDMKVAAAQEGSYDLNATDTTKGKPSYRFRAFKKAKRKIAEAEELYEWVERKGKKEVETGETKIDRFLEGLEKSLNNMIGEI